MTALPTSAGFTEATVTEAQFKARMSELRDYLAGLFGAAGTVDVALASLGALAGAIAEKTAAYTVVATDRGKVFSCSGSWTLGLPAASIAGAGFSCVVVNRGSGTITLDPNASELINGLASILLLPGHGGVLICTGTEWVSVGSFGNESIAHADGTAAAPAVYFSQDSDTGLYRTAANSLGLATGGALRARVHNGGLEVTGAMTGTAVTQSATDATAGRLMKVGDAGVLGYAPSSGAGVSWASVTQSQMIGCAAVAAQPTDKPGAGNSNAFLGWHLMSGATRWAELVQETSGSTPWRIWARSSNSGVTQDWDLLFTRKSVLGAVTQTAGVPTGAAFQIGSGTGGRFERRVSGQMRCQRTDLTVTDMNIAYGAGFRSADISWTFPSAFLTGSLPVFNVNGANADVTGFRIISISDTAVTFQLTGLVAITGAIAVRAAAEGRWSDMA